MSSFINAYSWINLRFLLEGLWVTVEVSVLSIIGSFIIGLIIGILRFMKIKYLSAILGVVIDIIRNLPLLLIIFFAYFGFPELGLRFSPFWAAIIALIIFESAMLAVIVRSGLQAVDPGQMEGARSNGLTYLQALYYVVIPQALHIMMPSLLSQFVSLVKDTSLATIILLPDLLYHAQIIYSQNTTYMIPMYLMVAILYFIVCFSLSLLASHLKKRLNRAV